MIKRPDLVANTKRDCRHKSWSRLERVWHQYGISDCRIFKETQRSEPIGVVNINIMQNYMVLLLGLSENQSVVIPPRVDMKSVVRWLPNETLYNWRTIHSGGGWKMENIKWFPESGKLGSWLTWCCGSRWLWQSGVLI